jgi:hypothetical protein
MKVRVRIAIALIALAVGVLPAVALAHGHSHGNSQNAAGHNKSSGTGSSSTTMPTPRSQAEKQCRQERTTLGKSAFDQTYGTNKNGKNAFGKCVAHRTKQDHSSRQTQSHEVQAEENAARQCRTEEASDPAAFKDKYGTNANKSNAFGKCVSQNARQQEHPSSGSGSTSG